MQDYIPMIKDALGMFLFLGVELSVLFIIISAGVSLIQQYIPDSKIQKLLGASQGRGYVMAAGLGAITPFCTCSTIPMLRGLLRAKAGFGPTMTFLFASPLLNPIIIALFVATFGMKVTIVYTGIALFVSILAGYILNLMKFEDYVITSSLENTESSCCTTSKKATECCPSTTPEQSSCCDPAPQSSCCAPKPILQPLACCDTPSKEKSSCCDTQASVPTMQTLTPLENSTCCTPAPQSTCCTPKPTLQPLGCCTPPAEEKSSCCTPITAENTSSCCTQEPKPQGLTFKEKTKLALKDGYTQFKQVLPYLLLGISLGSIIYGFVPSDFIATHASGDSLFAVPLAAVIGIPLYVRVEALIPLSQVLVAKGMGLGAVMALIIGGGGASLTEVILLKSLFKLPVIIAFLVVVLVMAISAGYLFQFTF